MANYKLVLNIDSIELNLANDELGLEIKELVIEKLTVPNAVLELITEPQN